jgi:hypothetical protein
MILVYTVVIALAAYRLFRLFSVDAITEAPREWVLERSPEKVRELVECPWCAGSWWAFGVTWLTDVVVGLQAPVLVALAAAALVGWIAREND